MLKTAVRAQAAAHRVRTHLDTVQQQAREDGERGDSPISTVIITIAVVTGALLIAGGLAALYAKYNGQLGGQ
jgi:hypothetical protein